MSRKVYQMSCAIVLRPLLYVGVFPNVWHSPIRVSIT